MARYEQFLTALSAVPSDADKIIVDLTAVESVDSLALGALILAKFRWDQEGRKVVTVAGNANVLRVMAIVGVIGRLNVVESFEDAEAHHDAIKSV
jgi:anti-anti-sigma factor